MPALPALIVAELLSCGRALLFKKDHGAALDLSYTSSFVSVNGLKCVEGPKRIAEGALALYKAGVQGELYNMMAAHPRLTCKARGYTVSTGEDPCYPGAQTFVRSSPDLKNFMVSEKAAETLYAMSYNLTAEKVALMQQCGCHPASASMASRKESCASINLTSCWTHHDPYNHDTPLLGNEGPFQYNTYVLAIMKSTSQLAMHRFDQIAPVSCASLGFPDTEASRKPDHCFPQSRMYFNAKNNRVARNMELENALFLGGEYQHFNNTFSKMYGLDTSVFALDEECKCFSNSEVARGIEGALGRAMQDVCSPTEHTSPIRDWFDGEWTDGQVSIGV